MGNPSTIHRGSVLPLRLFSPRMVICERVPGAPDSVVELSPATRPSRIRSMEVTPCIFKSLAVMTAALPVMWSFLITSIPVITTSLILLASSCIVTRSTLVKSVTRTVCGFMPIYVITSVAVFVDWGKLMANTPLTSVVVLRVEPFRAIVTPGSGSFVSSTTTPRRVTASCCASTFGLPAVVASAVVADAASSVANAIQPNVRLIDILYIRNGFIYINYLLVILSAGWTRWQDILCP